MPKQKLTQRSDGRFRCWYRGRQFYGSTMREAYAKRDAYKRALELGENPNRVTVRVYGDYWLPVAKSDVSPSTYEFDRLMLSKLTDDLGDVPLQNIRATDIKGVYNHHFLGLSQSYIDHAAALYRSMFDAAVEDGYIRINPARQRSAKPPEGTAGTHRAITQEERDLIETHALDHRVHPVAMVMLYAGLRPAEAEALDMADVDFEAGVIHVRASYHRAGKNTGARTRTAQLKTEKSTRDVPLFSNLADCLRGREGLIISDDGGLLSESSWRDAWTSYCRTIEREINGVSKGWYGRSRAQIELAEQGLLPPWRPFEVRPYDLRFSFCTWCRDNGVELHACIDMMGHTDSKMIMEIYDQITDTRIAQTRQRIEDALRQKSGSTVQNTVQQDAE